MKALIVKRYAYYSGIRNAARILSVISTLFLFMFLIGEGVNFRGLELREIVGMLFFPFGVVAGFLIAWKWETAGGLFSLISLLGFYLVYGLILGGAFPRGLWFFGFTTPALIFLVSGIYGKIAIADQAVGADHTASVETN